MTHSYVLQLIAFVSICIYMQYRYLVSDEKYEPDPQLLFPLRNLVPLVIPPQSCPPSSPLQICYSKVISIILFFKLLY